MLTQERYQQILQMLARKRTVTVAELTQTLGASEATVRRDLNALHEMGRLNKVHGGATALGHPIGASGARLMTTLIGALRKTGGKRGVATLCIGGGEAVAMAIEMV